MNLHTADGSAQFTLFDMGASTVSDADDYRHPDFNDTETPYCCDCKNWKPSEMTQDESGKEILWVSGPGVCSLRKKKATSPTGYCSRWKNEKTH